MLDSLRYWVREMHVDGFRFDLASTLMRDSAFVAAVGQDPLLREVKLIAEPWDMRGYDLGRFPSPWAEWNDQYRDCLRTTWHGLKPSLATLATRLSGSADIFPRRSPTASVNFVTAHDGFTLADLVSYERKHNRDNGEDNRDGTDANASRNGGVEGPTDDPAIQAGRHKLRRAQLATLLLSAGVPMLLAGDELGRTQLGNNNAYCQDNEISWVAWPYDRRDPAGPDPLLISLVSGLLRLRRRSPVLHRTTFFVGGRLDVGDLDSPVPDISWFRPDGAVMEDGDWGADTVTLHLSGQALRARLPARRAHHRRQLPDRAAHRMPPTPRSSCRALPGDGCTRRCWTPPPRISAASPTSTNRSRRRRCEPASPAVAGAIAAARCVGLRLLRVLG